MPRQRFDRAVRCPTGVHGVVADHQRRVRQARRVLRTLRSIRGPMVEARLFAYLRKIDPQVFEELLLYALDASGSFVVRTDVDMLHKIANRSV
jgi:hypothetical protein